MNKESTPQLRVQEREATLFAAAVRALTASGYSDVSFDIGGKKSRRRYISSTAQDGSKLTVWIKFARSWPEMAEVVQFPWKKLSISPGAVEAAELASEDAVRRGATHLLAVVGDETTGKLSFCRLYPLSDVPEIVRRQEAATNSAYYRAHSACFIVTSRSPEFDAAAQLAAERGIDLLVVSLNSRQSISSANPVARRTGYVYQRDEKVRAAVLEIAAGFCECCKEEGFLTTTGRRYLETHHVIGVAQRGPDSIDNIVAVCPLCHRKAHFASNKIEIERSMLEAIRKRVRPPGAEPSAQRATRSKQRAL